MLDFVIFAVTFVVVLISLVIYLYPGSRRQTTIDGLDPSHPKEGNVSDIIKAESFHEFLIGLHQRFGTMASFWLFGPTLAVSVRSEEWIKSIDYMTDKPKEVNQVFEPFVGENSVLFKQKHELRKQRTLWELMFDEKSVDKQKIVVREVIEELVRKWATIDERQHIPVGHYMKALTLRLCLISGFENYFRKSNSDLIDLSRSFEKCFTELESRVSGDLPEVRSGRNERFEESVKHLRQLLRKALESMQTTSDGTGLLRPLLNNSFNNFEHLIDESMTYLFMYYSLSSALMWTLYYLSSETKLQSEMNEKIGLNIENDLIDKFVDSAIDSANVIQWTSRVNLDVENQMDGHLIPKGTPIICSLSSDHFLNSSSDSPLVVFKRHFESSEDKPSMAFGSKGSKRCCPAMKYSKFIIKELIIAIIEKYEIEAIDSDLIPKQIYRIYSKSEDEIWIKIKKRQ